ncbi:junction-mediating and -regulatory protein-like isoform X2 [Paramormyrops kingsleyae]|uniref:Junction mediating and regulatory protein, p53 cofactor n=1 Tax=Paramormyrops kingsleyae TaxID=1676925 RepID=A0A3B3T2J5_9TELE|nr:junction-mediating and -regulatory protein-like isoform X2 [Paramormyrops kingsleyae]
MSFTMEDTLESGWVAVRPNVFEEKEKHKFVFIVAWNKVEGKLAITCHNRTVQRRSIVRDSEAGVVGSILENIHACCTSPVREKAEYTATDNESSAKTPTAGASAAMSSPIKSSCKVTGPSRRDVSLNPPSIQDDPGNMEDDYESGARGDYSWAGLFSFQDLRAVHLQLCSINSELEPCLPAFPEEPSGMWTVLFGLPEVSQAEMDALCCRLQLYLGHVLDTCGWKILSPVLFAEGEDPEAYYESLSELRQEGYEEAVRRAKAALQGLLDRHRSTESMVELLEIYQAEDEAYFALVEATTLLYQFLLQPFRDMRELAMLRRQQIKISIENDYLGPRRIESLKKEDLDWQSKAHQAVLSIQDFTVKYFEITAKAQKAVFERMRADQRKFGKAAWAAAVERMERLQCAVSKETLQLMRAREICLEQKKQTLREQMQALQGGEDAVHRLDQLEAQYYELQLHLYEIQFEVLKCEELLLTTQRESLQRQITDLQEEVVYYDTFESTEAMQGTDDSLLQREELLKLQQRVRQLEARRGRITAKKAYLKNKREICVANHKQKMQQRQGSQEDHMSSQTLQQHVEQQRMDEESQSTRVSQERQKTLEGLRRFKQRYPGQVTLKSRRLRLACSPKRRLSGLSRPGSLEQPQQTLEVSVQTETEGMSLSSVLPAPPQCPTAPPLCGAMLHYQTTAPPLTSNGGPPVSLSPLPPSAPPPPPPPLAGEEPGEGKGDPASLVQQDGDPGSEPGVPRPLDASSSTSCCFFDSSQLIDARKRLRKTPVPDTSLGRRASSPMDEVLASLKRGSFRLRRVELRPPRPEPSEDDDTSSILAQIRKGVRLRRVPRPDEADPLLRSIQEAMCRIKEASPESESEDEGLPCADWDS